MSLVHRLSPLTRDAEIRAQDLAPVRDLHQWRRKPAPAVALVSRAEQMKSLVPFSRKRTNHLLTCLCSVMVFAISCSTQETNLPIRSGSTETAAPGNAIGDLSGLWVGTTRTGGLTRTAGVNRSLKLK